MLKIFIFIVTLLIFPPSLMAQENKVQLKEWSQLPVLHEGRIKPLDSFARIHLKIYMGSESVGDQTASQWLAESLFMPEISALRPIFKIRNFENYGLTERREKLYSFIELEPFLNKKKELLRTLLKENPKNWTAEQQEFVTLYNNFLGYNQLLRSLTALLPLNIQGVEKQNYLSLKNKNNSTDIIKSLKFLRAGGENNSYIKIIPSNWNNFATEWLSPWFVLSENKIKQEDFSYLNQWAKLAIAYREGNQKQWDAALSSLPQNFITLRIRAEYFYNFFKFLTIAGFLYLFSFLLIILNNIFQKKILLKIAKILIPISALLHTIDIAMRIYILERAPVGTLYESIIFVALICVLGCLFIERKQKNQTILLLASLSGSLLLTVANSFVGEDSMNTLVAVLNTNFWLLTHVICITIGYATCLLASGFAHYYLIEEIRKAPSKKQLIQLKNATKTIVILSLLFTTIGTILGGIWADQSWGRFWGWDPKENGAMLIVLWLIWILHGKISKHLTVTSFMVATAFLSVIVILAWFGVNLLNVGLHSYGFVSGIALGITFFCTIETLIIGILWFLVDKKEPK